MKKHLKSSLILVMTVMLSSTSTSLIVCAENAKDTIFEEEYIGVDDEISKSGDVESDINDVPIVNTEEEELLENRRPEDVTGMDESGAIYSLDDSNGIVEQNSRTRSISSRVVNFNTKGFSGTTSYTEVETGTKGYTCGAYGADAAYLGTSAGKVKFMLSGVIGQVDSSEVQIINISSAKSLSHYVVSQGKLLHRIATNLNSESYGSTLEQGNAPSYLQSGVKYYSYDGHYFYTEDNYDNMLNDYNNGNRSHSVNADNPFYNYFQYLPLRSRTDYSGELLNTMINNYSQVTDASKMQNIGNILVTMQDTYGTHALIMTGIAANESNWGKSNIAQTKNNLFGMNAVDSSPGESANYYSNVENCIKDFSETYMSRQYLNPLDWKYYGAYLGNKASGINVKYASDPYWGEKAANIAWMLDRANGNLDVNKYTLGIKDIMSSDHTALNIRREATTASAKLYNTGGQASHAFIILGEAANFYKIQSEPVLNNGRTAIDAESGKYDFNAMYAYASKDYITKVCEQKNNSDDTFWASESIDVSIKSPQPMSAEINLTAKVSGNTKDLSYKFVWMKDNWNEWGVIRDFSKVNNALWSPKAGGDYKLYMDVKDSSGKMETVVIDYKIKNWGILGINTNVKEPQVKGSVIAITPQLSGDTSKLRYKFVWMKDNWNKWGVIQEFSTNKTANWKPTESGEYDLYLDVKDDEGVQTSAILSYSIVNKLWVFNGITVDKSSPQEVGVPLKITAEVDNAGKDVQYKFVWMKDNWNEWGVIQDYSAKNVAQWIPDGIGKYSFYVDVKDNDERNTEHKNIDFNIVQGNWKISALETTPDSVQKIGNNTQIKAQIAGNRTGLKYKFVWQKEQWKDWGVIQDFSTKDVAVWKAPALGEYDIYVDVKDLTGRTETYIIPYEILNKSWKYKGIEVNQNSPQEIGTQINITPDIAGSADGLQYKYVWMKDDWAQWGVVKEFSDSGSAGWIPKEVGEYKIYVDVKEKGDKNLETKWIPFTVKEGTWTIAGISFDLESPQITDTEIEVASRIIGNKTGLKYKFVWMKDNWNSWGVIQDKGTKTKATWMPSETGQYKIYLDVFDSSGKTETYIQEYEIVDWGIITKPLKSGIKGKEVVISLEGVQHNKYLQYKFVWMKNDWKEWEVIRDFSEKQTAKWIPEEIGEYFLYVDIKNVKTGKSETKRLQYIVR